MAEVRNRALGSPSDATNWLRCTVRPVPHRTSSVNSGVRGRGGGCSPAVGRGGCGWRAAAPRSEDQEAVQAGARPARARRNTPPPLSAAAGTGQPRLAPRSPLPPRSRCPPASGGGARRSQGSEVVGPRVVVIHKAWSRTAAAGLGLGLGLGLLEDAVFGSKGHLGGDVSVHPVAGFPRWARATR